MNVDLHLREFLGSKEYNRFVRDVLLPLYETELPEKEFAQIASYVERFGPAILDMWAQSSSTAENNDNKVIHAEKEILPGKKIGVVIKKFHDKAKYKRSATIQEILGKGLPAHLQDAVPHNLYRNDHTQVIVTPTIPGNTLSSGEEVKSDNNEKSTSLEDRLRPVISRYLDVMHAAREIIPSGIVPNLDSFTNRMATVGFFTPSTIASYELEIASHLDSRHDDFLHGDLHNGNVVVGKSIHFLDFEMSRRGFWEFDLYKLFAKNNVSLDLENRLISIGLVSYHTLCGKTVPTNAESDASYRRFKLNQVTQDIFVLARYLKNRSPYFNRLAQGAYLKLQTHISETVAHGFLSQSLATNMLDEICAKNPLVLVADEKSGDVEYGEHHLFSTRVHEPAKANQDKTSSRNRIEKKLRSVDLKRKLWNIVLAGCVAAAPILAFGVKYMSDSKRFAMMESVQEQFQERIYKDNFRSSYEKVLNGTLHGGLGIDFYGANREPIKPVNLYNHDVENVCNQKGVAYRLVQSMYEVNESFVGMQNISVNSAGFGLLDPYSSWFSDSLNPKSNLESGIIRLIHILQKNGITKKMVDAYYASNFVPDPKNAPIGLINALVQFYSFPKNTESHPCPGCGTNKQCEDAIYDRIKYEESFRLPNSVRNLVYGVLRGGVEGDESGCWMNKAAEDFLPNNKFSRKYINDHLDAPVWFLTE